MSVAIKAYQVLETGDGTGGIIYAKTNAQARREGACTFGSGDFFGVECRRASWADQYAPHGPSRSDLFEMGWWFECEECGAHARHDAGGIEAAGGFYCEMHADFYAWRVPRERGGWRRDDFVWMHPSMWWPPTALWEASVALSPDTGSADGGVGP
jgi:hypothetical protein